MVIPMSFVFGSPNILKNIIVNAFLPILWPFFDYDYLYIAIFNASMGLLIGFIRYMIDKKNLKTGYIK